MDAFHYCGASLLYVVSMCISSSCSTSSASVETGLEVTIEIPAGTEFTDDINGEIKTFLPYLTNMAQARIEGEDQQIAIIGKRMKRGDKVRIKPFANLEYKMSDKIQALILAVPTAEKYRSVKINSYDDFITEFYGVKQTIEYWYANRYGLGYVSDLKWNPY